MRSFTESSHLCTVHRNLGGVRRPVAVLSHAHLELLLVFGVLPGGAHVQQKVADRLVVDLQ